jgi:hypothetical protein
MKDEYVKFGTAKLLKGKGFDEHCHMVHINNHNSLIGKVISNSELITTHEYKFCKDQENCITIPTQQMACRWVRKRGIHIMPTIGCDVNRTPRIFYGVVIALFNDYGDIDYRTTDENEYDSPEEAIEAALEYVLKNLI